MARSALPAHTPKKDKKSKKKVAVKGPAQPLKVPKPWDQRKAKKGDESEKTLFTAVGRALSSWTNLEMSLTALFSALCGTEGHADVAVRLAYGSVRTFEGRVSMLDAVQKWFFVAEKAKSCNLPHSVYGAKAIGELEIRVEKLFAEARNYVSRRNELAHGKVNAQSHAKVGANRFVHLKKPRYLFLPAYMELTKHDNFVDPKFEYNASEIAKFIAAFEKMANEAATITVTIRNLQRERLEAFV